MIFCNVDKAGWVLTMAAQKNTPRSARKALATGTNLAPQLAIETLFRGKKRGRPTGLEPATARTTIWSSTIELRPPLETRSAPTSEYPGKGFFRNAEVKLKFYRAGFKPKSRAAFAEGG